MDKMEEAEGAWKQLRNNCGEDSEYFFTAIEVALRFHRSELYESLIDREGSKFVSESGFINNLAHTHLKNGNLGGAWRILSSNGINPLESDLGEEIYEILD